MFRVVDVGTHGDDTTDRPFFRHRGCGKDGQSRIACKVSAAANAVHHLISHDVSGVDVAVQITFNGGIHGDQPQAPDQLRIVGNLLGADYQPLPEEINVFIKQFQLFLGERNRRSGGPCHLSLPDQLQRRVLYDFGIHAQAGKAAASQTGQYSIGHAAHARLDGGQRGRLPAGCHLLLQERDDVRPDSRTDLVRLFKHRAAARIIGHNDGGNLAEVTRNCSGSDALCGIRKRDRLVSYSVDVMHAVQLQGKSLIDLQNNLIRLVQEAVGSAHCRRRDHAILRDSGTLHQGKVNMQTASVNKLRHMA